MAQVRRPTLNDVNHLSAAGLGSSAVGQPAAKLRALREGANSLRTDSPAITYHEGQIMVGWVLLGGLISEQQVFAKCAWRLIPLIVAANCVMSVSRPST